MATSIVYGATVDQENRNESDLRYDFIGKNSEVFSSNDIVGAESGVLRVVPATAVNTTLAVVGTVVKTVTMASTNQTVAKVTPGYVPVADGTIFLMGTNSDLTGNATNGGTYYGITGTTGVQQIDVTTGVTTASSRVVEVVKVDPFNEGGSGAGSGLRKALVRFVKTPYGALPTGT